MRQQRITSRRRTLLVLIVAGGLVCAVAAAMTGRPATRAAEDRTAEFVEIPVHVLADKIHGGLLGQILGNLNGLPHEFRYIDEPGNVAVYIPGLPAGARTDDDTDIEWAHIVAMERGALLPPQPDQLVALWRKHLNRGIYNANRLARRMMDLGIAPPLSGHVEFNPWSDFNIAGQFCSETYGLIAPAMPQTAARTAIPLLRIAVDGEPIQSNQLFTTMIAVAFVCDDVDKIIDAGQAALDPKSQLRPIIDDVRQWHRQHPQDWRKTRAWIRDRYTRHGGGTRDYNGYELNTAAIIAALLYGQGDFVESLRLAFNMGWDADCTAATVGTILGVIRGYQWMHNQGWEIKDVYRNTTRDEMPQDETISRFARRIAVVADTLIRRQGGSKFERDGQTIYRIRREAPANVEPLPDGEQRRAQLRQQLRQPILKDLRSDDPIAQARAAYLAICLELWPELQQQHPEQTRRALESLNRQKEFLQWIARLPQGVGVAHQQRLRDAGVQW